MGYYVYEIEGIDVNFPFKAYPQQLEYMQEFIKVMKCGMNGALEAPTGFGKSLCIIAPYIAFQRWYDEAVKTYDGLQIQISQLRRRVSKKELIDRCSILMNKEITISERLIDFLMTTVPFSKSIQINNNLFSLKSVDIKQFQLARLIYTSRTHQQLKQVYQVVSTYFPTCSNNIMYFASKEHLCVNSITLNAAQEQKISLNTLCKHHCSTKQCQYNETKEIPIKGIDFEDFKLNCEREKLCPYNVTRDFLVYQNIVLCPYNYILDSINRNTDFHNVLINSIVVFDEAHSCYNNAKAVYEHSFTKKDIQQAVENIILAMRIIDGRWLHLSDLRSGGRQKIVESHQHLFQKYQVMDIAQSIGKLLLQKFTDYECLAQIEIYTNQGRRDSSYQDKPWYKRESLDRLFQGAPVKIFNQECLELLYDVDYYIYNTRINFKTLRASLNTVDEQRLFSAKLGKVAVFRKLLEIYANFLGQKSGERNGLEVVVEAKPGEAELGDKKDQTKCVFGYAVQCYTPALAFGQLLSAGIRCFLFTSGTLRPLESLDDQYGVQFRLKQSFGTVFDMSQRLDARIIVGVNEEVVVSGEFARRTPEYFDNIAKIVTTYISDVPNVGILLFLTSYGQLTEVETRLSPLQHSHHFHLLVERRGGQRSGEKEVKQEVQEWEMDFSEDNAEFRREKQETNGLLGASKVQNQDRNENNDLLKELIFYVKEKHQKTLVLAVLRGKLSEGIDFAGDLCRCVIIVGVPYLNRNDPAVARQLSWLDEQHQKEIQGNFGGKSMLRQKQADFPTYKQNPEQNTINSTQIFTSTVFYTQQAFQAVSQALGRLIRSERDYGRVLLVDQRYTYLRNYLPKFLQTVPAQTLSNFEASPDGFFARKEREMGMLSEDQSQFWGKLPRKQEGNELNTDLELVPGDLSLSASFEDQSGGNTKGNVQDTINKQEITLQLLQKTMGAGLSDRARFNPQFLRVQVEYLISLSQAPLEGNQLSLTLNNTEKINLHEKWWENELNAYLERRGLFTEYRNLEKQPIQIRAYNTVALIKRLPYAYGVAVVASAENDVREELYSCF